FFNDLRVYWLADRPIGARTFQLETRSATEPDVQMQIVSDIQRNAVKWIIIEHDQSKGDEKFREDQYHGSHILDDYISAHFSEVARFGPYGVLYRDEVGISQ